MPQQSVARAHTIDLVFDELTAITRRATARSRRLAAPLSYVEHSMLTFISTTPGCRATDVATSFHLNRSTVSRQLASLLELGLVQYEPLKAGGRGRALELTDAGVTALSKSLSVQREALQSRLESWSDTDVAALGALLARFNGDEPQL